MIDPVARQNAEAVRHFNRFYTRHIGALHEHLHKSAFSLTEVRVLQELSRERTQTAATLARNLGLDSGYLSRLLTSFERRGLISRRPSDSDARQSLISLTDSGRDAYSPLDVAATEEVCNVLERLQPGAQEQLIAAMKLVERLLDDRRASPSIVTLRAPRAGEYGWIVHRQAQLFAAEYGWDQSFEGMLAQTVADLAQRGDAQRETCWIAEQDGALVGSALLTALPDGNDAQILLLYVEPEVRKLGVGEKLVAECVRFAKDAGYATLKMPVASVLLEARRLASRAGFAQAASVEEHRYGHDLAIESWEREMHA
ncbi:bifunctional helix-turn-helix transcriptional regulator/GNAT family N-acetyltransferase [Paraburkholderia sp.]|uniref:bifunctional helix-turn-helix transcriptional regulator/GNAT family N-acetyltransferase n=1 Tax=Paraburkholderia sp. TaxID=1926495 RepID=UPI00239C3290|nr:bifunctional helix-turn-helix transcriptional regulator/GNAT family N-acetyltransferase [Paraburkholderia sp.]MDE1178950.1 bifunctional helix-turn-helix transcriptional regulator/GNAT family N-acetyltransferase [Paraburkholderia sp.]